MWADAKGNPVIIPIHINKQGAIELENQVASAYGKKNISPILGDNEANVIYTKNNESIQQILSNRLQLPDAVSEDTLVNWIISRGGATVKDFMSLSSGLSGTPVPTNTGVAGIREGVNGNGRDGILYEGGKRSGDASAGKQGGSLSENEFQNKGKSKNERQSTAKELRTEGKTRQKTLRYVGDNEEGKIKLDLIDKDAYNDDMRYLVEGLEEKGIAAELYIGAAEVTVEGKDGFITDGFIVGKSKMYLRYDGEFAPQILQEHEDVHINWDEPKMQAVKEEILGRLSEEEREKILSMERYSNYMTIYGNKEDVWQEFVADTLAGMNEYGEVFSDIVEKYRSSEFDTIDRYSPAEYNSITDAGGEKGSFSIEDYSERALPVGSMKNDFHKALSRAEWAQYYNAVNKFDWDKDLRTKDFAFVVKLSGKTILSTYKRGKPEVIFITYANNNFEEGVLYDRREAERIFGSIRENEIQRNKTSSFSVSSTGKRADGDVSGAAGDSKEGGHGRGVYDDGKEVLQSGISKSITDEIKFSQSSEDRVRQLESENEKLKEANDFLKEFFVQTGQVHIDALHISDIAEDIKKRYESHNTVKIIGKGGKVSFRPILPQYRSFFQELIKDKQPTEKLFDLPKNEKMARLTMSNEIRRITKALELPQTGKNHEFRKYHCQLAVEHYISKGWEREKAEKYVIQRHLSHSSERQDLKKIYLYS